MNQNINMILKQYHFGIETSTRLEILNLAYIYSNLHLISSIIGHHGNYAHPTRATSNQCAVDPLSYVQHLTPNFLKL